MTGSTSHKHDAFANLTPIKNRKVTSDQSKGQDDFTATFPDQSKTEEESKSDFSPSSETQ
jgi:hypothetical protein